MLESIDEIVHCLYNEHSNLFFISDSDNRLLYLMHTISSIKIQQLYNCRNSGINSNISELGADNDANIYMFFKEEKKMYKLVFNLQSDVLKE